MADTKIFVVLKLSRGASEVVAAFVDLTTADRFREKIRGLSGGTYRTAETTLYAGRP